MAARRRTRSWRCGPGAFLRALEEVRRRGGTVEGGDSDGWLRSLTPLGPLEGRYSFDGEILTITVTSLPEALPIETLWRHLDAICGPPVMMA